MSEDGLPLLYLDLDGVLVDFVGGVCRLTGVNENDLVRHHKKPLPVRLDDLFERPFAEINTRIDLAFWYNLDPYPWADELVEIVSCMFRGRVFLCTSAGRPGSDFFNLAVIGKALWVDRHYPHLAERLIFAFEKWPLAGCNRILVDDSEMHVERFQENKGIGVLFPQWWNSEWQRQESGDVLDFVKGKLKSLL